MSLTNAQYDAVMKQYDLRQLDNFHIMKKRREEAFAAVPLLKEIDRRVALGAVEKVRQSLSGRLSSPQESAEEESRPAGLPEKKENADLERRRLLKENGFPEDYLDPVFRCPDCRDTGLIGGKHCHCFDREVIRLFYAQSGLYDILQEENFDTLRLDYYPEDLTDPSSGLSSRQIMETAVRSCRRFVSQFGSGGNYLLLTGQPGLGKTFLSHCIAKELIESGHSVIYLSAGTLFDRLAGAQFSRDSSLQESGPDPDYIRGCDLLIIDDLGTEISIPRESLPGSWSILPWFRSSGGTSGSGSGSVQNSKQVQRPANFMLDHFLMHGTMQVVLGGSLKQLFDLFL